MYEPLASWMFNTHQDSEAAVLAAANNVGARVWVEEQAFNRLGGIEPRFVVSVHMHATDWPMKRAAFDKELSKIADDVGRGVMRRWVMKEEPDETEFARQLRITRERGW